MLAAIAWLLQKKNKSHRVVAAAAVAVVMLMLMLRVDNEVVFLLVLLRAAMAHKETYTDDVLALDATVAAAADAAVGMVSSSTFHNRIPHRSRRHWADYQS